MFLHCGRDYSATTFALLQEHRRLQQSLTHLFFSYVVIFLCCVPLTITRRSWPSSLKPAATIWLKFFLCILLKCDNMPLLPVCSDIPHKTSLKLPTCCALDGFSWSICEVAMFSSFLAIAFACVAALRRPKESSQRKGPWVLGGNGWPQNTSHEALDVAAVTFLWSRNCWCQSIRASLCLLS